MIIYRRTPELDRCLALCREFVSRADALLEACRDEENPGTHPKEHAALRRTGMELTRALAELRRGRPIESTWHQEPSP